MKVEQLRLELESVLKAIELEKNELANLGVASLRLAYSMQQTEKQNTLVGGGSAVEVDGPGAAGTSSVVIQQALNTSALGFVRDDLLWVRVL